MAPQRSNRNTSHFEDDDIHTDLNIGGDHDDGDEDEDEDEDRGDDIDDDDIEDDDDGDDIDDDDDDDDDDDGDDDDDDGDDGDEDPDVDIDEDSLRDIAGDGRVPLSRLNEVLEQNRQLMNLLAQRGGGEANRGESTVETPEFDLKAKQKERNEKLLEGDADAAAAIDDEIARHLISSASNAATAAAQRALEQAETTRTIADLQRRYPVLDDSPGNKKFDRDVLDAVVGLRTQYMARGMSMPEALRKAAKFVCGGRGAAEGAESRGRAPRNERTLAQKREALRRARAQPPRVSGVGASGRTAVRGLSEEELARMPDGKFKAIPERERRAARGDFIEPRGSRKR